MNKEKRQLYLKQLCLVRTHDRTPSKEKIIELRCEQCNNLLMNYYESGYDYIIVFQGIAIKCSRCKRIMNLKKYTEGMIKHKLDGSVFRL